MRLLGDLCFLQRHVRPRPVSAAILHVRVEEEAVEFVADVVMMLDVGARPALAVDRTEPRRHPFGEPPEPPLVEQLRAANPTPAYENERAEFTVVAIAHLHTPLTQNHG